MAMDPVLVLLLGIFVAGFNYRGGRVRRVVVLPERKTRQVLEERLSPASRAG